VLQGLAEFRAIGRVRFEGAYVVQVEGLEVLQQLVGGRRGGAPCSLAGGEIVVAVVPATAESEVGQGVTEVQTVVVLGARGADTR